MYHRVPLELETIGPAEKSTLSPLSPDVIRGVVSRNLKASITSPNFQTRYKEYDSSERRERILRFFTVRKCMAPNITRQTNSGLEENQHNAIFSVYAMFLVLFLCRNHSSYGIEEN